jgi:hypothetical protein
VIGRQGRWLHQAMFKSYLLFFRPEGLLAAGGWPGAAERDFDHFFAERFCVKIDEHFQQLLFPFAQDFAQAVSNIDAALLLQSAQLMLRAQ